MLEIIGILLMYHTPNPTHPAGEEHNNYALKRKKMPKPKPKPTQSCVPLTSLSFTICPFFYSKKQTFSFTIHQNDSYTCCHFSNSSTSLFLPSKPNPRFPQLAGISFSHIHFVHFPISLSLTIRIWSCG